MEVLESAGVRVRRGKKKKLELLKAYFDLAYASSGIENWVESERYYKQAKEGYDEEVRTKPTSCCVLYIILTCRHSWGPAVRGRSRRPAA